MKGIRLSTMLWLQIFKQVCIEVPISQSLSRMMCVDEEPTHNTCDIGIGMD